MIRAGMYNLAAAWVIVIAGAVVWGAGCGDDNGARSSNNAVLPGADTSGSDTADVHPLDGGGLDAGPDTSPDADASPEPTDLCGGVVDLGAITAGADLRKSNDTTDGTELVDPSCGTARHREVVYRFTVDSPARINLQVQSSSGSNWVVSVSRGACQSPTAFTCADSGADVFIADPSETYFVTIEPRSSGAGSPFTLAINTTSIQCGPVGASTCRGQDVSRCETGFTEVTYECPYACTDSACGADACANAIEVADAGAHRFSGSYEAYADQLNFDGRDDCTSATVGVNTPGQDLVFYLPGLTAGQTVSVDASDDESQQGIFILDEPCSEQISCAAGGLELDGPFEWTVGVDGDYYVVVDALEEQSGQFDIAITR